MKLCLILVLLILLGVSVRAAPSASSAFRDLGPQITASTLQGTTFARDPAGRDLVCTVMRGEPAKLLVFDVHTGELVSRLPLEGAHGAWNATTATDGSVYVGTDNNGHLYRWKPGDSKATDLGLVLPDQTFVWDVVAGREGEVFGGTYDGCNVFRYSPTGGFQDVGRGPLVKGENYVRGIAFDPRSGNVYAGIGAHAHLVELDPATGAKRELLPREYAGHTFCYSVDLVGDDQLMVQVTYGAFSLVLDRATGRELAKLPGVTGQQVVSSPSPIDGRVYFDAGGKLCWYDPKTHEHGEARFQPAGSLLGARWLKLKEPDLGDDQASSLVMLCRPGVLSKWNPATGKSANVKLKFPSETVPIQSISLGPDGRIWTGGYLSGGNAAYDPRTGKSVEYKGLSQSERIGSLGKDLYFGIYPGARISVYDTTRPWNQRHGNPRQIASLHEQGQDRPYAVLGVADLQKVFIGTISEYGALGGALSIYDPKTDKLEVHRNVVQDQSVVSLVDVGGLIYGGTTKYGGLGIEPSTREGTLFIWDPATNRKVFEVAPVPGAPAITGLMRGPDGNVWGVGKGELFIFDVNRRAVTKRQKLFDISYSESHHVWREADLALHPAGQVYGTLAGRLFRLDPRTLQMTVLRPEGADLLALDRDGRVYFAQRTNLWQYTPPQDGPR